MTFEGFPPDCVRFLKELQKNNDKKWFDANRSRFEENVQQPTLDFVAAMEPRIRKISKHIDAVAKKSGGSLLRIYRDTRFAKDKTPYNCHMSGIFRHSVGKKAPAPGFYFRIAADKAHLGTGIFQPEGPALRKIRDAIVAKSAAWKKARDDQAFRDCYEALEGDSLKRPPQGFAADHPLIEDLKRKDFVAFRTLPVKSIESADFLDVTEESYRASKPLMKFLCGALDLNF